MDSRESRRLIFKALGNKTRLDIVYALSKGEMCACDLPKVVNRAQPTVSLQLKYLKKVGIVESRRTGKLVRYKLASNAVKRLISC